ncbi:MAG: hypothetical protein ACR2GX_05120 [Candidatus Dormibacteria bacterium]
MIAAEAPGLFFVIVIPAVGLFTIVGSATGAWIAWKRVHRP